MKSGGELNPKYPGGVERARKLLEAEGHHVVAKGKKFIVADYEKLLFTGVALSKVKARKSDASKRK